MSNPIVVGDSEPLKSAQTAMKSGQFAVALKLCEEALAVNPDDIEAAMLASSAAIRISDKDKAVTYAVRTVELRPDDATGYAVLGRCLLASHRPEEAAAQFAKGILLEPRQPILYQLLGQALDRANLNWEAAEAFENAIKLAPQLIEAHISLGQLQIKLGNRKEASLCFRRAYRLEPHSARGLVQLAKAQIEDLEYDKAEESLLKAGRLDPKSPLPLALLGHVYRQCGGFEDASNVLLRAIEIQPSSARPYLQWVQCRRVVESDRPLIDQMSSLLALETLSEDDRWHLRFALGKAHEDLGKYREAMAHFEEGNRIMLGLATPRFDEASHREEIETTIRNLPPQLFAEHRHGGSKSDKPIFIVGMIRSGTTLVEQIVSSHPQVSAGGELKFWSENTKYTIDQDQVSIDPGNLQQVSDQYSELLETLGGNKERVTDKMPLNYLFLGAIHLAFPNARIIHCRRNPLDNCLSMFVTPFPQPVNFLHSRENIVFYYEQYLRLMGHWQQVIPSNRLLEVDYEDLISNREAITRQMIDFAGLDWDDACLRPEENARAVRTPSAWQVRQPIYRSSVGRWKNYEPWLGAFRRFLPEVDLSV